MNGRERVLEAINHREPDRVPITFDAEREVYDLLYRHFNISNRNELWDKLNVDTWLVGPEINDPREKDLPDGQHQSRWGYRTIRQPYTVNGITGAYSEIIYNPLRELNTVEELGKHDWPDPDLLDFKFLNDLRKEQSERAIIAHITHGGYFNGTFLRGMEQFLVDIAIDEYYAGAVIERVCEYIFNAIDKLLEQAGDSFDIYYLADDYCMASGPLFSPDVFGRLVKPYLRVIADKLHSHNKKFLLHVCGSVRLLLPEIIDSGVDMLEPVQRRAVGMELEDLKREFGKDLCFYGSIDILETLNSGNVQDVRDEVKRNIELLGNDGGFILGPGHTYIQIDAPVENILAMYEAAVEEGTY